MCIYFALLAPVLAQKNLLPGYVQKDNGDTLHGLIQYQNWKSNPSGILFKLTKEGKPQFFSPGSISAFSVAGELYESADIEKADASQPTQDWPNLPAIKKLHARNFLQVLIKGPKSLYVLREGDKKQFFIREDTGYVLLEYKLYERISGPIPVMAENKAYLGTLLSYLGDCPDIAQQLTAMKYKRNQLMQLFTDYYTCIDSSPSFIRRGDRIELESRVLVGASMAGIEFNDFYYLNDADLSPSTKFAAGVSLNAILPRTMRKWSFVNELVYSNFLFKGTYEDGIEHSDIRLGYAYLKWNLMVKATVGTQGVRPFFQGGISNSFLVSEINEKDRQALYFPFSLTHEVAFPGPKHTDRGFVVGAGINYKKYSLECRVEISNGIGLPAFNPTRVRRFYMLAGYAF